MSPESQRIAIAEAYGWEDCNESTGICPSGETKGCRRSLPDFPADLNACADFRKSLTFSQRMDFDNRLLVIVSRDSGLSSGLLAPRECFDATASQRAEAFLRTIGKWEGSK